MSSAEKVTMRFIIIEIAVVATIDPSGSYRSEEWTRERERERAEDSERSLIVCKRCDYYLSCQTVAAMRKRQPVAANEWPELVK